MTELIKVDYSKEIPAVSARELHEVLEVDTPYHKWFPRMCEYGFEENESYWTFLSDRSDGMAGKPRQDALLSVDMAKEICMIQRTEKGKIARQYFLQLERDWNSPEKVMARALRIADQKILSLSAENATQKQMIAELKPRADYTDRILQNNGLVTITQIAKDYGMSGQKMNDLLHEIGIQYKLSGQWLLYAEHHGKGWTHSETIDITRTDGRPDVKMQTKWTQKGRLALYDLLKDAGVLPVIEREQEGKAG